MDSVKERESEGVCVHVPVCNDSWCREQAGGAKELSAGTLRGSGGSPGKSLSMSAS